jgi:hypothetical protein
MDVDHSSAFASPASSWFNDWRFFNFGLCYVFLTGTRLMVWKSWAPVALGVSQKIFLFYIYTIKMSFAVPFCHNRNLCTHLIWVIDQPPPPPSTCRALHLISLDDVKYQITVTSFFHPDSFYIPTDAMKKSGLCLSCPLSVQIWVVTSFHQMSLRQWNHHRKWT